MSEDQTGGGNGIFVCLNTDLPSVLIDSGDGVCVCVIKGNLLITLLLIKAV